MQEIKDMTYSNTTFQKGMQLFESGALRQYTANSAENAFYADIKGTKKYEVEVYLDEYAEIDDYYCSCPAFESYPGPCKHVVAFLLAILNSSSDYRKERKTASKPTAIANKSSSYDVEQTKRLLDVLQFELLEENNLFDRVPIQVEYTMVMSDLRYGQHYSLKSY